MRDLSMIEVEAVSGGADIGSRLPGGTEISPTGSYSGFDGFINGGTPASSAEQQEYKKALAWVAAHPGSTIVDYPGGLIGGGAIP
ncbi:hypothetical protein UCD39_25620 [Nitrospirillum sp. BR 11752]|uniref:hypothetical protein n=1 Tax=Nitrospirillum sp. BR 11752 TaxID=3104293 RepID=UPI002EB705FD|nr:hypothetical protein [Nitrospirillum sp. BR 11752]